MLWVLKRYAWKPLLGILDTRRNKIQSEFDSIEEQKKQNEALKLAYEQKLKEIDAYSRAKTLEAVEHGKKIAEEIKQEAHTATKAIVTKAQEDLQKEVYKAKRQLKNEVIDLVLKVTEKVLQKNINQDNQKELIADMIEHMESH
jgi:F-type H+-transporting ATPase subunit b